MWDRTLDLGGTVTLPVCRERAIGCNSGTLSLSSQRVAFADDKGAPVFAGAPSEFVVRGAQQSSRGTMIGERPFVRLRLQLAEKKYNLVYLSPAPCTPTNPPTCDEPGLSQQFAAAEYFSLAIQRLAAQKQ